MNYLMALTEHMKILFRRLWQLLVILSPVRTNALRVHCKIDLMLKITEKINDRDKLFKKFKKSCLRVDKDNYEEARNDVQKLIHTKKKAYFESELTKKIEKAIINCLENDKSTNLMLKI